MSVFKIKSWSYSAYKLWAQCPQKYKFQKFGKYPPQPNEHLIRGIAWHKLAEDYLAGRHKTMPMELHKAGDILRDLRKLKAVPEDDWCFDTDMAVASWFDSARAWLRMKIDAYYIDGTTLHIYDHKTGKIREYDHAEQLTLYAASAYYMFDDLENVVADAIYLDHGVKVSYCTQTQTDASRTINKWRGRVAVMFDDKEFAPKPGPLCNWCDYRKSNGGPCEYA